jgi:hypothetical protein
MIFVMFNNVETNTLDSMLVGDVDARKREKGEVSGLPFERGDVFVGS